jgi:hypothetical protein
MQRERECSNLSCHQKNTEKDKIRLYRGKCREVECSEKATTRKSNDKALKKRKRQSKSTDAILSQKSMRVQ